LGALDENGLNLSKVEQPESSVISSIAGSQWRMGFMT
jgi:hypothetical protein